MESGQVGTQRPVGDARILHSLQYLELALSEPSPGVPQSLIVGDVDGTPYKHCDSERPVQWSIHGSHWHNYNRWDFICFQLGSRSYAVSNSATWITQRCWESKGIIVEQMKHYLGHTGVEDLPEYIRYGQEALEHKGLSLLHRTTSITSGGFI
ncbi:major histocompatibility complex class I-related gene protein-like [Hirundo rustica]|uniref:major histocompatibility complex class I-related gene protein-like n=1 Tax=Hirundo rustica TaxID=43150 RepID=UPI001A94D13B|nr:major histocompatibility complex class I-related gene protein-like [Hirundo rustica]